MIDKLSKGAQELLTTLKTVSDLRDSDMAHMTVGVTRHEWILYVMAAEAPRRLRAERALRQIHGVHHGMPVRIEFIGKVRPA